MGTKGPTTGQPIRYEYFYEDMKQPGVEYVSRYEVAVGDDGTLEAPLTYESCQNYLQRQRDIGRRETGGKVLEGEYWLWFYTDQNARWLPRNADYNDFYRRQVAGTSEYLYADWEWFDNTETILRVPNSWLATPRPLPGSTEWRHRYLISYYMAMSTPEYQDPIPYETKNQYFTRREACGSPLSDAQLEAKWVEWLGYSHELIRP